MSARKTKLLVGLLAVLIVVGVAEYTIGGGWKIVQRELRRRRVKAEGGHMVGSGQKVFDIPGPSGPQDAPIKIVVFLNPYNPCHKDFVYGWQHMVKPFADKIRLVFKDITSDESLKLLEGYPIGCETVVLLNGLMQIKVPWQDEPVVLEGAAGPTGGPQGFQKLIKWLLTDEGRKELKRQRAEFEAERRRRAEKERQAREKARQSKKAAPAEKTAPGEEKKSGRPAPSAAKDKKPAAAGEPNWSQIQRQAPRREPAVPFTPDSWAQGGPGACSTATH